MCTSAIGAPANNLKLIVEVLLTSRHMLSQTSKVSCHHDWWNQEGWTHDLWSTQETNWQFHVVLQVSRVDSSQTTIDLLDQQGWPVYPHRTRPNQAIDMFLFHGFVSLILLKYPCFTTCRSHRAFPLGTHGALRGAPALQAAVPVVVALPGRSTRTRRGNIGERSTRFNKPKWTTYIYIYIQYIVYIYIL